MSVIKEKVKTTFNDGSSLTVNLEYYEDAHSMLEDLKKRKITSNSFYDMETKRLEEDWDGVRKYEDALKLLDNGFEDVVGEIKASTNRYYQRRDQQTKRYKTFNDVQGFQPIVPLVLIGVPNNMINSYMTPIKTKVIDIYYDMTCSCSTSTEQITKNGIELLKCVLGLEKQGYKINLFVCNSYSDRGKADMVCVKVKDSNRPLDIKRLSYPVCHTSYFRVLGFDWYSKFPLGTYRSGYGYALGYHYSAEKLGIMAKNLFSKNAVYIMATEIIAKDEEHIKEILMNRLAAQSTIKNKKESFSIRKGSFFYLKNFDKINYMLQS